MAFDEVRRDLVHACRVLGKAPGFALAAIATLALGVGANTAIFSVVNALLIEPLPYRDAGRLVFVWADQTSEGYPRAPLSGPELKDLDERASLFDGFGAIWATTAALTGDGDPEQLRVGFVSTDYFSILGADAAVGRTFTDEDDALGPPTSILLSAAVWQRRFGGNPSIVGSRIQVNGQPMTVVGIMAPDFRLLMPPDAAVPDDLDAWVPFNRRFTSGPRGQRYLRVVGRMRSGVTLADAQQDIARIGREISTQYVDYGRAGRQFETVALHADATREIRGPLVALFGGVGVLLLIACVNVASLLLARAASRARETALRVALGAGYGRLVRQHLIEGLLLTGLGAGAGLLVARWGLDLLHVLTPDALSRLLAAKIDTRVVIFSLATVSVWGVLLSLAPLAESFRVNLTTTLARDGRRSSGATSYQLRAALIVGQIALSVVLLVGAALLMRTFVNVQQVDPGFRSDGILSFRVALPGQRYGSAGAFNTFARRLQTELASLPGVASAAGISHAPYDHVPNWGGPYLATPGADESTAPQADYRAITPGLFEVMGIGLIEGRAFTEADDQNGAPVVIVDQRLAARMWPGRSALGQRLAVDPSVTGHPTAWTTVVGVIRHLRHRSPVEEVREQVYFPERQIQRNPFVVVVRATSDAAALVAPLRALIARLDPQLPIYDVRPLSVYVERARATWRFTMTLAALFALVALVLSAVGVYGVVAYSVTERHHEFGVRVALGARAGQVMTLVVREGVWLAARGLLLGIAGAAMVTWWLRGQLYGVSPWDLASYAVALPVLALVAVTACAIPARRALSTSPLDALRTD
jgi:putative ABC transport system permease protein